MRSHWADSSWTPQRVLGLGEYLDIADELLEVDHFTVRRRMPSAAVAGHRHDGWSITASDSFADDFPASSHADTIHDEAATMVIRGVSPVARAERAK